MKKDKRLKIYKEHMFDKGLTSIVNDENIKKCEAFGYIDGFFNEYIYKELVLEYDKKEYLDTYNKYFEIGRKNWLNEDKSFPLKEEKKWFIDQLIVHDLLNNIHRNCFSEEYQNYYDDAMKYGVTYLSNGEINLSKPKK